jgi:hypothetical protein
VAKSVDVADAPVLFETFSRWLDCQFRSTLLDLTDEPLIEEYV